MKIKDNEADLSYFCSDYFAYFKRVSPYFQVMADLFRSQKPPADIMKLIKKKQVPGI